MKNTVFQAVAPKAPTAIPPPPGGGSWRWDGAHWLENTPAAQPKVSAVIDPHQAATATPAAD